MPILHPEPELVHISEKAPFGLSNQYIHNGYRKNFNSTFRVLKSMFMWHNETVNIWTHFIGAFFFLWLTLSAGFYLEPTVEDLIRGYLGLTRGKFVEILSSYSPLSCFHSLRIRLDL